jgi:hypothetical protein
MIVYVLVKEENSCNMTSVHETRESANKMWDILDPTHREQYHIEEHKVC